MKFFVRNNFLVLITFLSLYCNVFGQEIWVEDIVTGEPLESVEIFTENGSHNGITNALGKVSLKDFPNLGQIRLNLLGYKPLIISILEVLEGKKIIQMTSEDEILEEVLLSVARSQSTRDKIAEKVGIISQNEIELGAVTTGADLLEINPNIRRP